MSFKFNFHNLIYATKFEHMTRGRACALGARVERAGSQARSFAAAPLLWAAGWQKKRQPRIGWCFVCAHIQKLRFNLAPSLDLQLKRPIFHFLFGFVVSANSEKFFSFFCIWKGQFVFKLKVINVFKERIRLRLFCFVKHFNSFHKFAVIWKIFNA